MKEITINLNKDEATRLVGVLEMLERSYIKVVILIEWKEDRRQGYNVLEMLDIDTIREYAVGAMKLKENQELKEVSLDDLGEGLDDIHEQIHNQI